MMSSFVKLLHNWQTLVAGMLALIGALITVIVILFQIRLQKKQFEEHSASRLRASRAILAIALDEITERCSNNATLLERLIRNRQFDQRRDLLLNFKASIGNKTLLNIRDAIEFGDSELARQLSLILQSQQVFSSRLLGIRDSQRIVVEQNVYDLILLNCEIYARAARIFPYARFETDQLISLLLYDHIVSAVNILHFRMTDKPQILDILSRRFLSRP